MRQRDASEVRSDARDRSFFGGSSRAYAMAIVNEEYAIDWRTGGLARYTNASDMTGRVSGQH